ncbi:16S rRNA (cytosine(1402)-N(4))-methyltransferase RsmH [Rickettsiales endosymbiont of Stachyamoeba lipophora]|uniref:16S rRNA (cytosine(1402)-N(4))-methyltransferase RsmH n=1 Tax=Rickettsiales endosymbiont of Stachyamoeba lipophora TaxID=2486578 RepID=UPI000F64CF3D|nr:16S rRNA (cytosine(1402)-N(4))-methyltransferase RsmH [Rickettsiales endosymbiont of Stachyamoeba lipophora]AZL15308.1 16S rRNA (cytosine(1402)-N(4))-methyltransferase RsmH [Rickettsiales endosymbiont of Stachyamoeba lipophora]
MTLNNPPHTSVMLNEVVAFTNPTADTIIVDCTFGAGGYTRKLLEKEASVIAIDQDASVKKFVNELSKQYSKLKFHNCNYSQIDEVLEQENLTGVDGIVMDLGVSSMQLDQAERGFSFMHDGPLDMRMGENSISAYDIINGYAEKDLADIFYYYGGERHSRKIARLIIEERAKEKITTTKNLADLICRVVKRSHKNPIHPATRVFQAIRIAVNDELNHLKIAINKSIKLLKENGVLVIVSFHSLEDMIVKKLFKDAASENYHLLTKKPLTPTEEELKLNPRSSSAKMRVLKRDKL